MDANVLIWSNLPTFEELVEKGEVKRFTDDEMLDLTEENKLKIEELEDQAKQFNTNFKVIAVTEQTSCIGGECVNMTSYIYVDDETKPWMISNDGIVGFFANVVNHDWDIEEMGSVGLKEIDGLIKRVM